MNAFRLQTDKMSAIFAAFTANAGINAKKVRVRTVHALTKRNAHLRDGDMTGIAQREEIGAFRVALAVLHGSRVLDETENPAPHKYMRRIISIRFDLIEALVHPVDAIFTVSHNHVA